MPPHGWSWENFKRIGEIWGQVISLDRNIETRADLSSGRIWIETCVSHSYKDGSTPLT